MCFDKRNRKYLLDLWNSCFVSRGHRIQIAAWKPVIYPHPISWRSILILSTHRRLGLSSGLLPSAFPTKTLYTTLSTPIRATCPAHLILLDFITRIILGEQYKSFNSSLCNLLHSSVASSLLGLNILLNTMFSHTLSFLSSRNVNDQVAHPYKTTGKIIILYILIFKFLDDNLEDKNSAPNDSKYFLTWYSSLPFKLQSLRHTSVVKVFC